MVGALGVNLLGRARFSFWIFVGGAVAILLSVVGSIFEWRESVAERRAPP